MLVWLKPRIGVAVQRREASLYGSTAPRSMSMCPFPHVGRSSLEKPRSESSARCQNVGPAASTVALLCARK